MRGRLKLVASIVLRQRFPMTAGNASWPPNDGGAIGRANMPSDIRLNDNSVVVDGALGVGTDQPKRPLHVEGAEVHSGGTGAGFSFADRHVNSFQDQPTKGERWVWYSANGNANLWSGGDRLVVTHDGK